MTANLWLSHRRSAAFGVVAATILCTVASGTILPNEWQFTQTLDVGASGLVRIDLPPETLDLCRSHLEDLRILDPSGHEVSYFIDRPAPRSESVVPAKEFRTEIERNATRLTIATGTNAPVQGVRLKTAGATEFIKPVRIEGSHDGNKWRQLGDREPIFRTSAGAARLEISFPEGVWEFLRLTIDDSRAAPIPFTGAEVLVARSNAATEAMSVTVTSRDESPGMTRIALNLGATNLTPASLQVETSEPLFTRAVTVAVPTVIGDDIAEQPLAASVVYRVDLNGKTESRLDIPIDSQIQSRELLLLISNGDSPPLAITQIRGQRRPVHVTFLARAAGRYSLLAGNHQCAAPNYDLSAMATDLKKVAAIEIRPGPPSANPDYKPNDNLSALSLAGATIDVEQWNFRKRVSFSAAGAQQIDLDFDVLSHATRELRDVRIVSEGRQIPFLLERTSILRKISLPLVLANDSKKPSVSCWSLKLPKAGLPITRIACVPGPGIFQREMRLSENPADERGDTYLHELGSATWRQLPNQKPRDLVIELTSPPLTDTLYLETDNGDNAAIEISDCRAYQPVTRAVFKVKAESAQPIWFYYGNVDASAPRYDVSLVADRLLWAERTSAAAGAEENMKSKGQRVGETLSGSSRYIFWGVLVLVVFSLLALIARLLPKTEQR
ncbi:MAG: hypothetical protein QOH39_2455 [Verrucomicrobiota bacterium]|jgi:hypothetical protein